MNLTSLFQRILGVNAKVRAIALALALSYTILRWPALLSGLPDDLTHQIFSAANDFLKYGVYLALWFLKQSNVTGNGTLDDPHRVATSEGSKTLPLSIVVAVLIPALALSGCGTPFGNAVAGFLDSPANRMIVNLAVKSGVDSLFESQGDKIPDSLRAPLRDAAEAAASALSSATISVAAQALRTKQGTDQDVSHSALVTAAVVQADVPPKVASSIAQAVVALNNGGVPADLANEAVAKTLDTVAAVKSSASQP